MIGNRPIYPVGLVSVASVLEADGHDVEIVDFVANPERMDDLGWMDKPCDILGFAIRDIDPIDIARFSFVPSYQGMVETLQQRATDSGYRPIYVGGGTGFSLFPSDLCARLNLDYVIVGEGEQALREICRGRASAGPVITRPDPEFAERTVDHPTWLVEAYRDAGYSEFGVETRRRKCIKKCQYCPYAYLSGGALGDFKSRDSLANQIRQLYLQGARHLFFTDAVFNNELEAAKDVCRLLTELALPDLRWSAYFVPSGFDEELAGLARASGVFRVIFSPDSFDPRMLRASGKLFGMKHVTRAREICLEYGLPDAWMLLFGSAREDRDTILRSAEFANAHFPAEDLDIHFGLRLLPGSPLAKSLGLAPKALLEPVFYPIDDRVFDWVVSSFDQRFFAGGRMLRLQSIRRAFGQMRQTPFENPIDPHLNFLLNQTRNSPLRLRPHPQDRSRPSTIKALG